MRVIDMRVRVPRKITSNNPEDFMKYYQDRAGFDEPAQKGVKWF
jgi:hypothetical protein